MDAFVCFFFGGVGRVGTKYLSIYPPTVLGLTFLARYEVHSAHMSKARRPNIRRGAR